MLLCICFLVHLCVFVIIGKIRFEIVADRPSSQILLLNAAQDMAFSFFISALEVLVGSLICKHHFDKIINNYILSLPKITTAFDQPKSTIGGPWECVIIINVSKNNKKNHRNSTIRMQ